MLICLAGYFQFVYERVEVAGPEMVSPDFLETYTVVDPAERTRESAPARLVNNVAGESVIVAQRIDPDSDITDIRVSVEARAANISAGDKPWHGGRVVLTSIAEKTNSLDYDLPHELFSLNGNHDWKSYSRVFHIYPGVKTLWLQVQLNEVTGGLDLRQLSVTPVVYKKAWPLIQVVMVGAFVIYLGWRFAAYCRRGQFSYTLFAALSGVVAIAIFTSIPLSLKSQIYQLLLPAVSQVPNMVVSSAPADSAGVAGGSSTSFFSLMHYLCFTATALLLLLTVSNRPVPARLLDLLILALATECMQAFVRDRGASLSDVLVDALGIATGFLLWKLLCNSSCIMRFILRRRRVACISGAGASKSEK